MTKQREECHNLTESRKCDKCGKFINVNSQSKICPKCHNEYEEQGTKFCIFFGFVVFVVFLIWYCL